MEPRRGAQAPSTYKKVPRKTIATESHKKQKHFLHIYHMLLVFVVKHLLCREIFRTSSLVRFIFKSI
jgi:hypothetical protein